MDHNCSYPRLRGCEAEAKDKNRIACDPDLPGGLAVLDVLGVQKSSSFHGMQPHMFSYVCPSECSKKEWYEYIASNW